MGLPRPGGQLHSVQHVGPSSARNTIDVPALLDSGGGSCDCGAVAVAGGGDVCVEDPITTSSVSSIS